MGVEYERYTKGISFTGDLKKDIERFFVHHDEQGTYQHTVAVANEAVRIATRFDLDPKLAFQAAFLHDISNVIPETSMIRIAESLGIELLEEEHRYHRIVHQKLSKDMAQNIFGCTNDNILNAVECHTTLKAQSSLLDKVLFVSDKISWELPGEHPYQEKMKEKIDLLDLNGAVLVYLNHIWEQRDKLKLVHPWLIEARDELLTQSCHCEN
ncbi:bis(5'-nucleosyl)-tetraphosphatase (symmetrical) YqeK [Paenibacillus elgii]